MSDNNLTETVGGARVIGAPTATAGSSANPAGVTVGKTDPPPYVIYEHEGRPIIYVPYKED